MCERTVRCAMMDRAKLFPEWLPVYESLAPQRKLSALSDLFNSDVGSAYLMLLCFQRDIATPEFSYSRK